MTYMPGGSTVREFTDAVQQMRTQLPPRLFAARATVPALAVGVAKDVTVTWTGLAVAPAEVVLLREAAGSLLGQVDVTVKPGSLTATGCVLTMVAPVLVATSPGAIVVLGVVPS